MTGLRLGLIGAGPWGRILLRTASGIEGARIARIATRRPETLDGIPADCAVSADWRALIEAGDLDGVIIASPPALHREMAAMGLARGLAVFLEKPMALDVADAADLLALVREKRGILQIDHIDLFNPAWRALRGHLRALGQLHGGEARFGADGPVRSDVSALWDWAPHPVALALDLFGTPQTVRLTALKRREAGRLNAVFELGFAGDAVVTVETGNDFAEKERRFLVKGERGSLCYDDRSPKKLVRTDGAGDAALPVPDTQPLTLALRRFADAIRAGGPSDEDAVLGLGVVSVIASLEKAAQA